jgi:hypothetical protein
MTPSPQSAEAQERDAIHAAIREAGGVVHGDGNIFFTSADKFMRARALLPSSTASGEASAVQETEAQKASEQTAADVRAIHERMKAELAHNASNAGEATDTGRFRYRPDGPFGPDVIDSHTGKWMSIDLAREYAGVVNVATGVSQREQEDAQLMRMALTVIAGWPVTNAHDMDSHNMRQTAIDALDHDAQRLGRGKGGKA